MNVFAGNFTCALDKLKLVDVVLSLYAYCIACGRYKPTKEGKKNGSNTVSIEEGTTTETTKSDELWLSALIDRHRKTIFPPEWFGDSIEILEEEIGKCLELTKCVRMLRIANSVAAIIVAASAHPVADLVRSQVRDIFASCVLQVAALATGALPSPRL